MNVIQLVYAKNSTSIKAGYFVQELEFAILVKNFAFDEHITVHWAGNDNIWHVLPACYHCQSGRNREQWLAKMSCRASVPGHLPGKIRFALQYLAADREYWDNNHSSNYLIQKDTMVLPGPGILLVHMGYCPVLRPGQTVQPVMVAVHQSLPTKRVFIRWTTDSWKTYHQTSCFLQQGCHLPGHKSNTCNTSTNNMSVWTGGVNIRNTSKVEYAIGCETEQGEIWDNNLGINYIARRPGLKVLTLNLHCYQEEDQDAKFCEIAKAISEIDIDVVCLQEVGEEWNGGEGNRQSNAARIIRDRLQKDGHYYHLYTDWSHIGFDRYREGSAILSKYRFWKRDARYVSTSHDILTIHSRKVVMSQIQVPGIGLVNVFSVHLSWWKDGFWPQFEKLCQWAEEAESDQVVATLLCGDFNTKAGSHGYMLIADRTEYEDQFLRSTSPAIFTKAFGDKLPKRERYFTDDDRIDYIFSKRNCILKPISSRILFSGQDYKRVSDHLGYLTEFQLENSHCTHPEIAESEVPGKDIANNT